MHNYRPALIIDPADEPHLNLRGTPPHWKDAIHVFPYRWLGRRCREIKASLARKPYDLVVFSRNEQVAERIAIARLIRELRTGYTSFSGIDESERIAQMAACFKDLISGSGSLPLPAPGRIPPGPARPRRTFSLIFDCEQLGGMRFGLPRILALLHRASVPATFFITNLMSGIYANIWDRLSAAGHEVGLHGLWHEYLDGKSRSEQADHIARIREELPSPAMGANFIGRMDADTVDAMIDNGIDYYIYPAVNAYRPFAYPSRNPLPNRIERPGKRIYAIPVIMETYGLSLFSIKAILRSLFAAARRSSFDHITVLCHPFRDGARKRMPALEMIIRHMADDGRLPVTIAQLVGDLDNQRRGVIINEDVYPLSTSSSDRLIRLPKHHRDLLYGPFETALAIYRRLNRNRTIF